MKNKLKAISRYGRLLGLLAITASLTVSCANRKKTASVDNPYTSNPYYSTSGDSSSTASSAGSTEYPAYDDSAAYTPPAPAAKPETYPSYSGGGNNAYPSYTGGGNNVTVPPTTTYSDPGSGSGGYTAGGTSHTVAKGENLYRISLKYGTTVSAIQNANGLGNTTIYPGQVIQIP